MSPVRDEYPPVRSATLRRGFPVEPSADGGQSIEGTRSASMLSRHWRLISGNGMGRLCFVRADVMASRQDDPAPAAATASRPRLPGHASPDADPKLKSQKLSLFKFKGKL